MTTSKYNPNKFGRANRPHHNPKYIMPDGTYLLYGNGCGKFRDCFSCGEPDRTWNSDRESKYMLGENK